MPIFNMRFNSSFLPNATCISDILDSYGYRQNAFYAMDSTFAGTKDFFQSHKISMIDYSNMPKTHKFIEGWNVVSDYDMFEIAKEIINNLRGDTPFALYIATIDTHTTSRFIDERICSGMQGEYSNVIKCNDRIINNFIKWLQKQDFYKDTSIVVVGDHLSYEYGLGEIENRRIFNAFINPKFSKKPSLDLIKNRKITHFDIAPLILDSLGFRVESFGLGRNPLYSKTLLEQMNKDEFNKLMTQDSKIYEKFLGI